MRAQVRKEQAGHRYRVGVTEMGRDPGALEYTRWGSMDMTPEDVQAHAGHGVTRLVVPLHPLTCASNASRSQRSPPRTTSAEHPAHSQPPSKSQTTRHLPALTGGRELAGVHLSERAGRVDLGVCSAREVPGPGALCLDHLRGSIMPGPGRRRWPDRAGCRRGSWDRPPVSLRPVTGGRGGACVARHRRPPLRW